MAERLNSLANAQSLSQTTLQQGPALNPFNPRSVSFDIRSPEELAAVNEFLITLGRDVTGPASVPRGMHSHSDYQTSPQSYFDPETLAQLGIAGMPGVPSVPGSGAGYHGDGGYGTTHGLVNQLPQTAYPSRPAHPSLQSVQSVQYANGLYPSVPNFDYTSPSPSSFHPQAARRVSLSPLGDEYPQSATFHQPTPTHFLPSAAYELSAAGGASPLSSHSSMSTPPNATPPHLAEGLHSFDYMRPSRGPPPAVQLAPVDFQQRTVRTIVPLRSAGPGARDGGPPEPVQPKWDPSGPRRGQLKLTSQYSPSSVSSQASSSGGPSSSRPSSPTSLRRSDSLYSHLLRDGDVKLPPIHKKFRSPSPVSRESTLSPPPRHPKRGASSQERDDQEDEDDTDTAERSRSPSSTPSPPPTLPPIRTLAQYTDERLARGVGRIALEGGEAQRRLRQQHAALLRDMLVAINAEYRRRFGTPPPAREAQAAALARRKLEAEGARDVEMGVA
jgi:hypothetical protein